MDDKTFKRAVRILRGVRLPWDPEIFVGRCPKCGVYMLFTKKGEQTTSECLGCPPTDNLEEILEAAKGKRLRPLSKGFVEELYNVAKRRSAEGHPAVGPAE